MREVEGESLYQIVDELEKIKKSMVMDSRVARDEQEWQILRNHIDEINELTEEITKQWIYSRH